MKHILKKLNSNSGASLIIAILFALIAVFVGGSVLAAATANGGRLANRRTTEQGYLSQRSAATLLADKLTPTKTLTLTFERSGSDTIIVTAGDSATDPADSRNDVLELFYETAAATCIRANYYDKKIQWSNFKMAGNSNLPVYYTDALANKVTGAPFSITDPVDSSSELGCVLLCSNTADETYPFTVYLSFDDSQLRLKLRASTMETKSGTVKITWKTPSIIKEGSDK